MNRYEIAAACGSAIACGGLGVQLLNLREFPALRAPEQLESGGVVACIAMRNEERNAAACVESLLRQPELFAVVVVDDHSTDGTANILEELAARDARVGFIRSDMLPYGVSGKAQALASASAVAALLAPKYLYFTDADVRHRDGALAALVQYLCDSRADAVSAWLGAERATFCDDLFSTSLITFLLQGFPMRFAREGKVRAAAGNGQSFLITASAYRRSGGHGAVRGNVEDVALAGLLRDSGARIALANACAIASAGGYGSFAQNADGYGRSLYFGAGAFGTAIFAAWQLASFVTPWLLLRRARYYAVPGVIASFCAVAISSDIMRRRRVLPYLTPVCGAAAGAAAFFALWRGMSKSYRWRGRRLE